MLIAPKPILATDVFAVAGAAVKISKDPDVQFSLLLFALISASKSCGVSRSTVLHRLREKWDEIPAIFEPAPPRLLS